MNGRAERFCPGCGRVLRDTEHICPDCGRSDGTIPTNAHIRVITGSTIRLNWATILLMLYGIISVVEGAVAAFFAEGTISMAENVLNMSVESLFGSITRSEAIRMLTIEGLISLFSGIFAIVAGRFCIKRYNLTIALGCTLAASIMIVTEKIFYPDTQMMLMLVQCLIGLLVFRMIYNSRDAFEY